MRDTRRERHTRCFLAEAALFCHQKVLHAQAQQRLLAYFLIARMSSAAAIARKLAPLGDRVLVKRVIQEAKVRQQL